MTQAEGIREELKAADQMGWVGRMNNLCNRVAEVVLNELIYVRTDKAEGVPLGLAFIYRTKAVLQNATGV